MIKNQVETTKDNNENNIDNGISEINIDTELNEIRGLFPEHSIDDFYWLENGDIGTHIIFDCYGQESEKFEIVLEYTNSYPEDPPRAWLLSPETFSVKSVPHCWKDNSHQFDKEYTILSYLAPSSWEETYTSFDALLAVERWIQAYVTYKEDGIWDWDKESILI